MSRMGDRLRQLAEFLDRQPMRGIAVIIVENREVCLSAGLEEGVPNAERTMSALAYSMNQAVNEYPTPQYVQ